MKPRRPFYLLFCLLLAASVGGQDPFFPAERRAELQREIDFGVPEDGAEPARPASSPRIDLGLTGKLLVGGLLAAGLGAVLFVTLRDARRSKKPSPATSPAATAAEEERLVRRGVDPARIEEAEASGQYELALRYHYLSALHRLDTAGLIRYRKDHGNREYRQQLPDDGRREEFGALARAYERYWFGQYPLASAVYPTLRDRFRRLADNPHTAGV